MESVDLRGVHMKWRGDDEFTRTEGEETRGDFPNSAPAAAAGATDDGVAAAEVAAGVPEESMRDSS